MIVISALPALGCCAVFTATFVGSLYVWKQQLEFPRDHPVTIRRRFISIAFTCLFAFCSVALFWNSTHSPTSLLRTLGVHSTALLPALTLPLLLTAALFLGPLVLLAIEPELREPLVEPSSWIWWRNIVVGPLSEEWVFRASMLPLLLAAGFGPLQACLYSPLFFGAAHLHHIVQHLHKRGVALREAWMQILFQLFYTTVFGLYSGFLFVRTGHLISAVLAHAFCNHMGFPRLDVALQHPQQRVQLAAFVGGVVLFAVLLMPLTDPTMYDSVHLRQ